MLGVNAQRSLFRPLAPEKHKLPDQARQTYQRYVDDPDHDVLAIAKIGNLAEALSPRGELTVGLTGITCATKFHYRGGLNDAQAYHWYGRGGNADGTPNDKGNCVGEEFFLSRRAGKSYGYFTINEQSYYFMPLDEDYVVLYTYRKPHTPKSCGVSAGDYPTPLPEPEGGKPGAGDKAGGPCFARGRVRVLIGYTQLADQSNPDIRTLANLSFSELQQGILNSRVDPTRFGVELAGITPISTSAFIENYSIDFKTEALRLNQNRGLANLRAAFDADLVLVLTGNGYAFAGVAPIPLGANSGDYAAIVTESDAVSAKTFMHEFGHLVGGHHDTAEPVNPAARGYAFRGGGRYPNFTRRGTVLAVRVSLRNWDPAYRLLQFSNPRNLFRYSVPTGTLTNDMTGWLHHVGPQIAAYRREPDNTLPVEIGGENLFCSGQRKQLFADLTCRLGFPRYRWELSSDNVNYRVVSRSATYTHTAPTTVNYEVQTLRLTVTDVNSVSSTSINLYTFDGRPECYYRYSASAPEGAGPDKAAGTTTGDFSFLTPRIFPNPVARGGNVSLGLSDEDGKPRGGSVTVYDALQRNCGTVRLGGHKHGAAAGKLGRKLSTGELKRGVYFLIFRDAAGNPVHTQKLIVR